MGKTSLTTKAAKTGPGISFLFKCSDKFRLSQNLAFNEHILEFLARLEITDKEDLARHLRLLANEFLPRNPSKTSEILLTYSGLLLKYESSGSTALAHDSLLLLLKDGLITPACQLIQKYNFKDYSNFNTVYHFFSISTDALSKQDKLALFQALDVQGIFKNKPNAFARCFTNLLRLPGNFSLQTLTSLFQKLLSETFIQERLLKDHKLFLLEFLLEKIVNTKDEKLPDTLRLCRERCSSNTNSSVLDKLEIATAQAYFKKETLQSYIAGFEYVAKIVASERMELTPELTRIILQALIFASKKFQTHSTIIRHIEGISFSMFENFLNLDHLSHFLELIQTISTHPDRVISNCADQLLEKVSIYLNFFMKGGTSKTELNIDVAQLKKTLQVLCETSSNTANILQRLNDTVLTELLDEDEQGWLKQQKCFFNLKNTLATSQSPDSLSLVQEFKALLPTFNLDPETELTYIDLALDILLKTLASQDHRSNSLANTLVICREAISLIEACCHPNLTSATYSEALETFMTQCENLARTVKNVLALFDHNDVDDEISEEKIIPSLNPEILWPLVGNQKKLANFLFLFLNKLIAKSLKNPLIDGFFLNFTYHHFKYLIAFHPDKKEQIVELFHTYLFTNVFNKHNTSTLHYFLTSSNELFQELLNNDSIQMAQNFNGTAFISQFFLLSSTFVEISSNLQNELINNLIKKQTDLISYPYLFHFLDALINYLAFARERNKEVDLYASFQILMDIIMEVPLIAREPEKNEINLLTLLKSAVLEFPAQSRIIDMCEYFINKFRTCRPSFDILDHSFLIQFFIDSFERGCFKNDYYKFYGLLMKVMPDFVDTAHFDELTISEHLKTYNLLPLFKIQSERPLSTSEMRNRASTLNRWLKCLMKINLKAATKHARRLFSKLNDEIYTNLPELRTEAAKLLQ